METIKKILEWAVNLPLFPKIVAFVAIMVVSAVMFFTSCSSTRAVVRNPRNSATTSITLSVSNPQTVEVSPSADSSKLQISLMP